MNKLTHVFVAACALAAAVTGPARANLILSGPDANDGSYSTAALAAAADSGNTVNVGGLTGITVWGLLGGAASASPLSPVYGAITTSTPAGSNGKNAILRYYLVATGASGQQSVISMGEINPSFGAGPQVNSFIAFQATGGGLLAAPSLIVPGQPGRNVADLTSLALLSVPALPSGGGGQSTTVALSGNVGAAASYTQTMLRNNFTPAQLSVPITGGTDLYTGVPLWSFLNPTTGSSTNQIVITQATDGYEVVLALSELDPSLGATPCDTAVVNTSCALLPYADTGTDFPNSGVARTIFPGDNKHGRWESNLNAVIVVEAPEPGAATFIVAAIGIMAALRRRVVQRSRQ